MIKTGQGSFNEVVENIQRGDERFTKTLYQQHKLKFVGWFMKKYQLNEQEGLEVYHQCFLVFYYQVKDGRLTALRSTLDTYLFGIGKNLMLKEQARKVSYSELAEVDMAMADKTSLENEDLMHKKLQIRAILRNVSEPCKSILTLYYFREFSLESIAEQLGYKNSGSVKKKKSLCLKHIREQLSTQID